MVRAIASLKASTGNSHDSSVFSSTPIYTPSNSSDATPIENNNHNNSNNTNNNTNNNNTPTNNNNDTIDSEENMNNIPQMILLQAQMHASLVEGVPDNNNNNNNLSSLSRSTSTDSIVSLNN